MGVSKQSAKMAMDRMNGTHKSVGKEAPQRAKAVGWQAVAVVVARLDEKKINKTTNKNRRKETKENQKRKKMEVQAKATTNDRNKRT